MLYFHLICDTKLRPFPTLCKLFFVLCTNCPFRCTKYHFRIMNCFLDRVKTGVFWGVFLVKTAFFGLYFSFFETVFSASFINIFVLFVKMRAALKTPPATNRVLFLFPRRVHQFPSIAHRLRILQVGAFCASVGVLHVGNIVGGFHFLFCHCLFLLSFCWLLLIYYLLFVLFL